MAYSPAGMLTTSATLPHLQAVVYRKKALDRLQTKFQFDMFCMKDILERQSGLTVQWFRYSNLSVSVTPTTEGTVGSSLTPSSRIVQATLSQFSNFINFSDLLAETGIDPVAQSYSELLGYHGGLLADTVTRNVLDAESANATQSLLVGTTMTAADVKASRHILANANVKPMDDGFYYMIMSPFVSFDILNDPTAVGIADIYKYNTPPGFQGAFIKLEDRGEVVQYGGVRIFESTNVKTQSTPNRYRVYVAGLNGIGSVDLEGRGPTRVKDPTKQRFNIRVVPGGVEAANIADPEGVLGGAVSYNFKFAVVVLEGPAGIGGSYRFRVLDPQSTLG